MVKRPEIPVLGVAVSAYPLIMNGGTADARRSFEELCAWIDARDEGPCGSSESNLTRLDSSFSCFARHMPCCRVRSVLVRLRHTLFPEEAPRMFSLVPAGDSCSGFRHGCD